MTSTFVVVAAADAVGLIKVILTVLQLFTVAYINMEKTVKKVTKCPF